MEPGTLGDSGNGLDSRLKVRWSENSKVYTRRFNKKAQKTSINNDSATASTTTTTTGNPAVSTTSTTKSSPAAKVPVSSSAAAEVPVSSSATTTTEVPLSTTAAAEVPLSTVATAKNTAKPDAATCPTVIASSAIATTTDDCKKSDNAVEEFSGTSGGDIISIPQRKKEKYPDPEQQLEQLPHQEHGSEDGVQEGIPTAEPQNLKELSSLTSGNDINNLKETSPQGSTNELPQGSAQGPEIPRTSSPQASVNQLRNGKEAPVTQTSSGCELQNCVEPTPVPSLLPSGSEPVNVNGNVKPLVTRVDDRVRFNLSEATPRDEIIELKKRLESELERVKMLFKQLETKDANVNSNIISSNNVLTANFGGNSDGGYVQPQPQYGRNDAVEKRVLVRLNSEVGSTGGVVTRPMGLARVNSDVGSTRYMEPRPYGRQLSVAVMQNNHTVGEFVEKEKRTPKANQYYRNSEFLLGKDRLPPESNKRGKSNNKRKFGRHGLGYGFPMDKNSNQVFRSCSNLLQRLMKHKYGWVFNEPVNAKAMGLHDYHDIIKHPMDLGTIKNRLSQNWYKSPGEFAEDVRLVFQNAMTYNPKGQDVHVMAEQLSEIFEERWAVIEAEYNHYWKYQMYHDAGLPTPTSRKAPPQPHFAPPQAHFAPPSVAAPFSAHALSAPQMMALDRSETVVAPPSLDPKFQRTHVGRMPVPKKPKAKDPHKRDMTYEEKQRLSKNLQNLPPEKLDAIVQIIKKRNTALSQNDDEIEVDIDTVDAETLWELDRFVTNFKKSLSKYKRKAELALQASAEANSTVPVVGASQALAEVPIESGPGGGKGPAPHPPAQGGKQGYNASRSSSSSSSSSDSGSSSSDSDSDSSSADGSDGGH